MASALLVYRASGIPGKAWKCCLGKVTPGLAVNNSNNSDLPLPLTQLFALSSRNIIHSSLLNCPHPGFPSKPGAVAPAGAPAPSQDPAGRAEPAPDGSWWDLSLIPAAPRWMGDSPACHRLSPEAPESPQNPPKESDPTKFSSCKGKRQKKLQV